MGEEGMMRRRGRSSASQSDQPFRVNQQLPLSLIIIIIALILLSVTSPTFTQGFKFDPEMGAFKYKIIRRASSFTSTSTSSSSSQSSQSSSSSSTTNTNSPEPFDYIIVGGGTAGCPLAATVSEKYRVLLLERGGVPFNNMNVSLMQNFHLTLADLSHTSASQYFVSTDGVFNSRARVLGGGTCINAGFYTRAEDSFIKSVGWDPQLVNESYPWVEQQIVHLPNLANWQRAVRDGLLSAGISPFNGFTYDHIYGTKVGGTIFEENGRRRTAAELLASGNPKNLKVLVHATVQNIIFDTTGKKKPKAVGVVFKDEHGALHRAYLSSNKHSNVIISSGAIGSPQMLLLSGIGPEPELNKLNITVIHHNPHVGKQISDNPLNTIFIPTKNPVTQSLIQTVGVTKKGVYIEASSGYGQSPDNITHCRHHGIASAEIGQLSTLPPRLRSRAAIDLYKEWKKDLPHEAFQGGFILTKIADPKSRGELHLMTKSVDDNPSVTFNYFSHPDDVAKCVEGVRIIERVVMSERFKEWSECVEGESFEKIVNMSVKANVNLIPRHVNDTSSLEQFCKDTVITIWHYHGGCEVGKVVDEEYRVVGVEGLRVVDGSTFRVSPGTNPQATVMMMGRYMGVKIMREREADARRGAAAATTGEV